MVSRCIQDARANSTPTIATTTINRRIVNWRWGNIGERSEDQCVMGWSVRMKVLAHLNGSSFLQSRSKVPANGARRRGSVVTIRFSSLSLAAPRVQL